jgi:large subunit ribosomal protein L21
MYAILRAGGKQVKVAPGDVVRIEKPAEAVTKGQEIVFSDVVFAGGREAGAEKPEGRSEKKAASVSVRATVLGPVKTRKVLVFKKKRTKQYRRTKGHRQSMIEVRIDGIDEKQ